VNINDIRYNTLS